MSEEINDEARKLMKEKGYEIEKFLGSGSYGKVYKAYSANKSRSCAVKVMELKKMSSRFREKCLPRELSVSLIARHQNLVRVWDIFRASEKIFIFMEFAPNGSIRSVVKKRKGVKLKQACKWLHGSCEGIDHMHNKLGISHHDLKCANILLGEKYVPKVADFGFARLSYDVDKEKVIRCETYSGTAPYSCPNKFAKKPYDPFKSDVWSMGIVFFCMIHNKTPYRTSNKKRAVKQFYDYPAHIRAKINNRKITPKGRTLLEKMLHPNEKERLSITDVLSNEWLVKKASAKEKAAVAGSKSSKRSFKESKGKKSSSAKSTSKKSTSAKSVSKRSTSKRFSNADSSSYSKSADSSKREKSGGSAWSSSSASSGDASF